MPVYHVGKKALVPMSTRLSVCPTNTRGKLPVLFRLKQGVTPAQITTWTNTAQAMVGKIPGLISLKANQPLPICVPRAKGFDMGLVAVLESPQHVEGYAVHPAHLEYVSLAVYAFF